MKHIQTLALTAIAAAFAAAPAMAQQVQPQNPQPQVPEHAEPRPATGAAQPMPGADLHDKPDFDELDVRGDGRVTRTDLAAHPRLLEKFDEIDRDGDGTISEDEYRAWKQAKKDGDKRSSSY